MSTTKKASEVQPLDLGKEIHVIKDGVDYAGRLSRMIAVETTLFPAIIELMVEVGSTSINFRLTFDDEIAILEDEPQGQDEELIQLDQDEAGNPIFGYVEVPESGGSENG